MSSVIKASEEKRFLLCVVYSPHRLPLRGVDKRVDLASPDVLEKACWSYAQKGCPTGMFHRDGHEGEAVCVENMIYRGPDWDVHGDGSLIVRKGDWLAGFKLSPAQWAMFRAGEIGGVSFQGTASRKKATAQALASLKEK